MAEISLRNFTKADIIAMVNSKPYLEFGLHKDLKALCCMPYAEDEDKEYEELVFVVPKDWLTNITKELYEVEDVDSWLQNEYTTDESEELFFKALRERQIVMIG